MDSKILLKQSCWSSIKACTESSSPTSTIAFKSSKTLTCSSPNRGWLSALNLVLIAWHRASRVIWCKGTGCRVSLGAMTSISELVMKVESWSKTCLAPKGLKAEKSKSLAWTTECSWKHGSIAESGIELIDDSRSHHLNIWSQSKVVSPPEVPVFILLEKVWKCLNHFAREVITKGQFFSLCRAEGREPWVPLGISKNLGFPRVPGPDFRAWAPSYTLPQSTLINPL